MVKKIKSHHPGQSTTTLEVMDYHHRHISPTAQAQDEVIQKGNYTSAAVVDDVEKAIMRPK